PEDHKRYETDPSYFAEIYIMNADGSGQKRLTFNPGYDGGPFFMPDGQRIIWRRFETNGVIADVFTMNLDGTGVHRVTHFQSMSWAPYPHPSGKYIIFTSNKHGFENFELFLVDTEGRHEPVRVTYSDDFDGLPVFSPDGKKLCWTSNRKGKPSQLFLADWNDAAALAALEASPLALGGTRVSRASFGVPPSEAESVAKTRTPSNENSLSPEIRAEDARAHVYYLASDALEGRQTGEPGARKAADYLATELEQFGVEPLSRWVGQAPRLSPSGAAPEGIPSPYFEPFTFTAGTLIDKAQTTFTVTYPPTPLAGRMTQFDLDQDFRPLAFSSNGKFDGQVVFAGYGLSVPGTGLEAYDSYAGLNVSNKIALVLRYVPEGVDPKRRAELNRYAAPRYKAMIAREHGAKAILIVSGPNSPTAGELIPLSSDGALAGSEILAASISTNIADHFLAASGKKLKDLQTALDTENPHAEKDVDLTNMTVHLRFDLERQKKTDENVIGVIPGTSNEYVMLGAHYDHLGYGESGDSRQHASEQHQIHNGADDNASGVSAVLELAANFATQFKESKPKRGVIFALWSGEEMGLLGSAHFTEHPPIPLRDIVAYLNFDMVGRLRENKLILQGAGSSTSWRKEIEKRNIPAGFDLTVQSDPYLPTDTTSFYPKGIPVLAFFTGSHDDYHRPSDDADKINYEGIERITKFARSIVQDLITSDSRPNYEKVKSSSSGGDRDALRVYLGTIPDYATEVKGVKLSGVRGGSPAEKGGLQGGDIIIEFAGQKIANIYDYTYALDAAKIGQPLKIKVLRDNKPLELTVTPEARK
ncbi:MAG TPA: M28 family peptidase, partial [Verrucomicrobiae bacterium]|nr:M28 family peptidase [Verrucomicrobiae bacterium]